MAIPKGKKINMKTIIEYFKDKEFTQEDIDKYCKERQVEVVEAGQLEDYIYQYKYDERISSAIPRVLEAVAKLQHIPTFDKEDKIERISKENENIALEIAQICEEEGIEYREIGFLKTLAEDVARILQSAEIRMSQMGANVLAEMAKEHIGDPLTVRALGERHREIANAKFEKESGKVAEAEEEVEEAEDVDNVDN